MRNGRINNMKLADKYVKSKYKVGKNKTENKSRKLVSVSVLFFCLTDNLTSTLKSKHLQKLLLCYILVQVLNHLLGKSLFLSNLNLCA